MHTKINRLNDDPLPWLLELDSDNPGVHYFALRDLVGRPDDDPEVRHARSDVMRLGPVPAILGAQHPVGYWAKPGGGYSPSYRATLCRSSSWQSWGPIPATSECGRAASTCYVTPSQPAEALPWANGRCPVA